MRRLDDFLRLLSYLWLGHSYRAYTLAKRVYWALFRRGLPHSLPRYSEIAVIVEGFAHSGNCFIRSNILPGYHTNTPGFHRTWAIKQALEHGVPTVVLFRHPLEVSKSWYYRSLSRPSGPIPLAFVLLCWTSYHKSIWHMRNSLLFMPFGSITRDYDRARATIERFAPIRMNCVPYYGNMNRYSGARPPLSIGLFSRFLLWRAELLYNNYLAWAENQAATEIKIGERPSSLFGPLTDGA